MNYILCINVYSRLCSLTSNCSYVETIKTLRCNFARDKDCTCMYIHIYAHIYSVYIYKIFQIKNTTYEQLIQNLWTSTIMINLIETIYH